MSEELNIRISGEAGQGMQTIGMALCRIFVNAGFDIFANQDYMSRIRGGNNFFQLRISNKPLYALREKIDIVVALDKSSVEIHKKDLADNGIIIVDRKKSAVSWDDSVFFDAPLYGIANDKGGSELFTNTVSCGVLSGMIGIEFTHVEKVLEEIFSDKNEEIIKKNIGSAKAGYDFARDNFKSKNFGIKPGSAKKALLMNGNEAVALGAIKAGCKFYSAYPMTPSTSIMNFMTHYADDFNILVEQAEDEIAAVNMIIGASFAGVRSMTSTSGGGFALMVEGLSLAGMTETPAVIAEVQRPGPATGLPTRTEQSDLEFVLHAGHGEFARVIFTPGSIEEAFYLTIKAFDIAEKYQIPVVLMSDQHLADSYRNIGMLEPGKAKISRYIISKKDSQDIRDYKRYRITKSGISPRAVPSWIQDVIYADSDEHTEEGHITESAEVRSEMVKKRFYKKVKALSKKIEEPVYGNIEGADVLLVGCGSTYGVLREISVNAGNKKIGFVHLRQIWPFPSESLKSLLKNSVKLVTVEGNASSQLARLIRRETGIEVNSSILRFDGRPFTLDYIMEHV